MQNSVLIVDDEEIIRKTVKRVLDSGGMNTDCAENGKQCLEKLRAGFRGVILMDVQMPEMDGWQTIQNIVEEGFLEGNIICMLTGLETPHPKMEKLKEYVMDYIRKPFQNEELIQLVKDYLSFL